MLTMNGANPMEATMTAFPGAAWWPSLAMLARVVVAAAAIGVASASARADREIPIASAEFEQLLAKVRAEHPDASILKVERERSESNAKAEVYEVKLLRPDGQVLKLYYDAATLAPVIRSGDDDDERGKRHRHRERRRDHW